MMNVDAIPGKETQQGIVVKVKEGKRKYNTTGKWDIVM